MVSLWQRWALRLLITVAAFCAILSSLSYVAFAQSNRRIVELKDFRDEEVRAAGFTVSKEVKVHLSGLGGGEKRSWENWFGDDEPQLYAGGWIIDANSRALVWEMDFDNTEGRDGRRTFAGDLILPKGSYEVYFAAYAFQKKDGLSGFSVNIDRRQERSHRRSWEGKLLSFLGFDSQDRYEDFMELAKEWGISVEVGQEDASAVSTFEAPKAHEGTIFKADKLVDEEVVRKTLRVNKDVVLHIRAIGEGRRDDGMYDYGWIVRSDSRERVWEMTLRNTKNAGGALKNRVFDGDISLSKGTYELVYVTDGSHSTEDWNSKPPSDPYRYGISLDAKNAADRKAVTVEDYSDDNKNVIVYLTRVRDKDFVSAGFSLKADTKVRVYAIGEWDSDGDAADYGWIVNAKTRERAWSMERRKTYHAGGAQKNRVSDEIITLSKGSYIAYFQTDGSHAYNEWNSDAPFDEQHWGLTIYGAGESFDPNVATSFKEEQEENVIAQIIRVRGDKHVRKSFTVSKPISVRIYAIGEGVDRNMADYGWIEDANSGRTVWEMTYRMTEHAGGAKKNRMVSTTLSLQPGEYLLHYETDGSHSFEEWNDDPPEDRIHWGITVYRE